MKTINKLLVFSMVMIFALTGCSGVGSTEQEYIRQSEINKYEENVLIAITQTKQDAEEIAEKCGITLESWENEVAVFYTEDDLDEIIRLAEELNLPPLSKNYIMELH